jgi:hypothetical protein
MALPRTIIAAIGKIMPAVEDDPGWIIQMLRKFVG